MAHSDHVAFFGLLPLIMWSAFRLNPSITFASVVFISAAANIARIVGGGSFMGADINEELIEIIISFVDITHIKQSEQRLDHLAHHDALTELPNRLLFNARLQQSIDQAKRHAGSLALVFVDLDRFKHINDSQGHPAGDELLKQTASRLSAAVRQEDTVARISGDEFMVLLEDIEQPENAGIAVEKLIRAFKEPFFVLGHPVHMTASMGICIYPQDGQEADELMRNADIAMYRAKEDGRNGYQFFSAELTKVALEHAVIDGALKGASVIALGHALGQTIIAEGVETEAQAEFLKAKQCDQAQGYLYGKPVAAEELEPLLPLLAVPDTEPVTAFAAQSKP